jgi:hypothetical protein
VSASLVAELDDLRARRPSVRDAGGRSEPRLLTVRTDQVEQRERQVLRIVRKSLGRRSACRFSRLRFERLGTKISQRSRPALPQNLRGDLVYGRQNPTNAGGGGLIRHRAVGDGEVRLLDEAVTVNLEREIVHPGSWAAMERSIDQGLKHVPDLVPTLADRLSQRLRMFCAEDWDIGIVIDRDVVRSPPEQERETVGEQAVPAFTVAHLLVVRLLLTRGREYAVPRAPAG